MCTYKYKHTHTHTRINMAQAHHCNVNTKQHILHVLHWVTFITFLSESFFGLFRPHSTAEHNKRDYYTQVKNAIPCEQSEFFFFNHSILYYNTV